MSALKRFLVLFLFLSACAPNNASTETPQLDFITVLLTPDVYPIRLAVETCASQTPDTPVFIKEGFPGQIEADLLIRLGEPDDELAFIAQIAEEELALAVHPSNTSASLSIDQVKDIFSGRMSNWLEIGGNDAEIQVWVLLTADEARGIFDQELLGGGRVTPNAFLAPHPSAILEAISGRPNAIGYLPRAWSTGQVSIILLGIKAPVLVVAEQEPQGAARELAACLQGELGQSIITPFYSP